MNTTQLSKSIKALLSAKAGRSYNVRAQDSGALCVYVPRARLASSDRRYCWDTSEDAVVSALTGMPLHKCFGELIILPALIARVHANLAETSATPISDDEIAQAWKAHAR